MTEQYRFISGSHSQVIYLGHDYDLMKQKLKGFDLIIG
jgi:hypothetical protein